jgi:hypothetical protein
MSKRSRQKAKRRAEAERLRNTAAVTANAPDGLGRPSIAQIVLQRVSELNPPQTVANIKTVDVPSKQLPVVQQEDNWPDNWPRCPATCSKLEWERALQNKEHYELASLEDDLRKPWFQYPKHPYQYSEFVFCTPEMMGEMLKYMPINRDLKESWADAIARDITNDRWLQTHESIAINTQGNMHDGQHRAQGILKANKGWPIYITWNVPPEAIYVTDSGEKRKINEKLALLFPESKLTQKTAALCRSMMWGLSTRGVRYSESEIAEFAVKYAAAIAWVHRYMRAYRADLQAVIAKAVLWWGEEAVLPFVERLNKIEFTGDGDPAKALYLWLMQARQKGKRTGYANPLIYYKKTLAAIHAHVNKKSATKLYQRADDVFEWLPGWNVPENAPHKGKIFVNDPLADLPEEEESSEEDGDNQ